MTDFPTVIDYSSSIISTMSEECPVGTAINANGNVMSTARAWTAANLAIYIPFMTGFPVTIVKMFWQNGLTVGTNHMDIGIYDSQGDRLVSSGSTLTSGVSTLQVIDITDTLLQPGLYYMAMASDATTDTITADNLAIPIHRAMGVYEQATAFPLPATATFTGSTHAYCPLICMMTQTLL